MAFIVREACEILRSQFEGDISALSELERKLSIFGEEETKLVILNRKVPESLQVGGYQMTKEGMRRESAISSWSLGHYYVLGERGYLEIPFKEVPIRPCEIGKIHAIVKATEDYLFVALPEATVLVEKVGGYHFLLELLKSDEFKLALKDLFRSLMPDIEEILRKSFETACKEVIDLDRRILMESGLVPRIHRTIWTAKIPEELPHPLKKTYDTVELLVKEGRGGGVTADEVSQHTGRSSSCESSYMSLLARRGFLEKRQVGKRIFYLPKK